MAKNLVPAGPKQFVDISEIVRVPAQRNKLQSYVDEAVRCRTKILDERESIKSIREAAVEEFKISPKLFNFIVDRYFNNDFDVKEEELDQLSTAIQSLMQTESSPAREEE